MNNPTVLVTGAAGFIGSHVCEALLARGHRVVGVDNFCDFYPRSWKEANVRAIGSGMELQETDITDGPRIRRLIESVRPQGIIHLAAMAGVRPSIEQPVHYAKVNLEGTTHLLQAAAEAGVQKFVFASSSSVYGNNAKVPFAETDDVSEPISPYAATKRAGELLAHTFWHLYKLPVACLRFFTVYGPRQRPDLAIHKFARMIHFGKTLPVYGDGSTSRDYTYISDIVDGVDMIFERPDLFAGRRIPEFDELVVTGRGEGLAVGRERGGIDAVVMAVDRGDDATRVDVPDLDFALLRGESARSREEPAIGREGDGAHLFRFAVKSGDGLVRRRVNQTDALEGACGNEFAVGTPRERVDLRMRSRRGRQEEGEAQ